MLDGPGRTDSLLRAKGAAASFAIQSIEQHMTRWAGAFERMNAYAYFAWLLASGEVRS